MLLLVALVNLLATAMLALCERERDVAILKTLGLTPRQAIGAVVSGGGALALLALPVGIPLGLVVLRVLFGLADDNGSEIVVDPAWWWLVLLVPGAVALAGLASALPAARAAATKPAQVLRFE